MVWDLWKSYAHTFRCLTLLRWKRTSRKGAMQVIFGSNLYCSLLNSTSPLICIVGKQQKHHKSRSLNHCFFANQQVLFFAMPFLPNKGFALKGCLTTAKCECLWSCMHCPGRMFVKQHALPRVNVCEAGLISKCECFWSSRTDSSSSYLLLKIKQFCSSQNRQLFT